MDEEERLLWIRGLWKARLKSTRKQWYDVEFYLVTQSILRKIRNKTFSRKLFYRHWKLDMFRDIRTRLETMRRFYYGQKKK